MTGEPGKADSERKTDEVGVLVKALDILECLAADGPATAAHICRHTAITKPAAYRILKTLDQRGCVVRDDTRREYSLGPALVGLSRAARNSTDLVSRVRPTLESLRNEFDETVNLGVVNRGAVVYLDTIESAQRLRSTVMVALQDPVHSTALGKAVLSAMPEESAREQLTLHERTSLTANTITDLDELMRMLARYRRDGYAVDDEENEVGSRCVGAPIMDGASWPVAAISVSAPVSRMPTATVARIGERLADTCRQLSALLP